MNTPLPPPKLAIVVPCYNEALVIDETIARLHAVLENLIQQTQITADSFLYLVDDGSQDETWRLIAENRSRYPHIKAMRLSRNFGHQNALLAGLLTNKDRIDCAISIDADLQQDVAAIPEFITQYRAGFDMVFGVRRDRRADNWFKRMTASGFYRFMKVLGVNVLRNHPDYRLMNRKVLCALAEYSETNLFLRALCVELGFKTTVVYYDSHPRFAGVTKYPLRKMLAFAWNGITSFSIAPLRWVTLAGFSLFFLSLLGLGYVMLDKLWDHGIVPGWASTMIPIYLLGGVQIFCIGILGEYVGKIYQETKRRPRFICREEIE